MTIKAGLSLETISSDQIKYRRGRGREADACFYEITPIALTDDERSDLLGSEFDTVSINLKVFQNTEMNVYLYGGSDRFNALLPIVDQNEQVTIG